MEQRDVIKFIQAIRNLLLLEKELRSKNTNEIQNHQNISSLEDKEGITNQPLTYFSSINNNEYPI